MIFAGGNDVRVCAKRYEQSDEDNKTVKLASRAILVQKKRNRKRKMNQTNGSDVSAPEPQTEGVNHKSEPDNPVKPTNWPVIQDRQRLPWFPARQRLIGLVRCSRDSYVLPPAVVRKASWRE